MLVLGKHVRSSFESKKVVSTSRHLELLYMDLCRPIRVQNRGGKIYVLVIVDDYSRFIWTIFLETSDEIFDIFVTFVKKFQRIMDTHIASIRFEHETEFKNANFIEFCANNGMIITFLYLGPHIKMLLLKERIGP